jgi:hypothetical protein
MLSAQYINSPPLLKLTVRPLRQLLGVRTSPRSLIGNLRELLRSFVIFLPVGPAKGQPLRPHWYKSSSKSGVVFLFPISALSRSLCRTPEKATRPIMTRKPRFLLKNAYIHRLALEGEPGAIEIIYRE